MATGGVPIPPRLQKSNSIKREGAKSSVDILQQMGFNQLRAEKAIAATGDRNVQLAADWLLSHVNDPFLDDATPRQYILYLCPIGELQEQLMAFYDKSLATCGWNGSHSYFPHITLCSFLSVENNNASRVKQAFQKLESMCHSTPGPLALDFFSQANFIGLFVQENYFKYLSDLVAQFAAEMNKYGIVMEASAKKQLHITLAYQYSSEHQEEINKLAKQINVTAPCNWELRVYSRDNRIGKCEVRKVLKEHKGSLDDELDLIMGDYIFMDTNETTRSEDGWYNGTSWVTGMMGMFPGTYTQRTAETWTWAIHGSLPLNQGTSPKGAMAVVNGTTGTDNVVKHDEYESTWRADDLYAKVDKNRVRTPEVKRRLDSKETKTDPPQPKTKGPRQFYVMRHGERMDFVFGRVWVDKCFDDNGNYNPTDLNMPKTIPKRMNHLDYFKDAPLTSIGSMQAFWTGEALKSAGVTFDHVYVSPSLRCVQTATGVLRSMGVSPVLHVEPGIFEWLGWYQLGLPKWFTPAELKDFGYNIDVTYKPYVPIPKFDLDEDIAGYYRRSGETARHILKKHEQGGNVLILGHAGSLEVCTRQVLGHQPRTAQEFREMCSKVPYCGLLSSQYDPSKSKWTVITSPIKPLSHGQNKIVNVKELHYPAS